MKRIIILLACALIFCGSACFAEDVQKYICGDYEYILLEDGSAQITACFSTGETVELPSELNGYPVSSISDMAFLSAGNMKTLWIPDGLSCISAEHLLYSRNLEHVYVTPDHPELALIDGVLFNKVEKSLVWYPNQSAAESYTIPNGIRSIGVRAFTGSKQLRSISIPDSVVQIGDHVFSGCVSLMEIAIPDRVEFIGTGAFYHCNELQSAYIGSGVTEMGGNPFAGCGKLENIVFSAEHPMLEDRDGVIFDKTRNILLYYPSVAAAESYAIPEGTSAIADYAFMECDRLKEITIPSSVRSIGISSFSDCDKIERLTIPDGVYSIGRSAFSICRSLREIKLPGNPITLGHSAFLSCSALERISIPDGTKEILNSCFNGCESLVSVEIPSSVTFFGEYVFERCPANMMLTVEKDSFAADFARQNGLMYTYPGANDWLNG